jgi:hypothetical protein
MYNPTTHKVFASRDVIFHEFADDVQEEEKVDKTISLKLLEEENESSDIVDQQNHDQSGHDTSQVEATPSNNEAVRRSTRQTKAPIRYNDYGLMTQIMSVEEPQNFEEAKNHKEWMKNMFQL